jgi:hypothetical protein
MEKPNASSPLEEIVEIFRAIRKVMNNDNSYISFLEKVLITLGKEFTDLTKNTTSFPKNTGSFIEKVLSLLEIETKSLGYTSKELSKHRGKKVSKENKELYNLIEEIDKERINNGEDSNYVQSTKAAVYKRYKTKIGWKKHYKNFIDYKNNPLKKKSVIRKPS